MNIKVRQIYFSKEQVSKVSENCFPYFNTSDFESDLFLEYSVILKSYLDGFYKEGDLAGVLSWRFFEKARKTESEFFEFIRKNPGYDVYFINPFMEQVTMYESVWKQGGTNHPGLLEIADSIFQKLGYGFKASDVKNTSADTLYCNYWIGSPAFWEKYIAFTKPIHDYILENKNDTEIVDKLKSNAPYHYPVSYIPFLMERLFSTLLWRDPSIKYLAYEYSPLEIANLINELRGYEYAYKKIDVWYNLFHRNIIIRFLKNIRNILLKIKARLK
ncbi:MAG TPA: hypothetical protein PLX69_22455 [Leptospiraceae bacterium]|nr:hypothetical protein [Leptospiraceae bacterium]